MSGLSTKFQNSQCRFCLGRFSEFILALISFVGTAGTGVATEIVWTRMTAQFPVEASPWVGKFGKTGETNIIIVNRGGQVLLWSLEGKSLGKEQDGLVAQLPAGQWTTQPVIFGPNSNQLVFASVSGQVVCLDENFKEQWQHKLAGETIFGRAVPAVVGAGPTIRLIFSDTSGTLTCLAPGGNVAWTNHLGSGACRAPPKIISTAAGGQLILAGAGSNLFCCDLTGKIQWHREFPGEVITRAEDFVADNKHLIACGINSSAVAVLDLEGRTVWQQTFETSPGAWLSIVPRKSAGPLIVFTGLWGNLYAVDATGQRQWTHYFRSKTRAKPLIVEQAGKTRILVPAFNQHVYEFDESGELTDDDRLSGILPSALVSITTEGPKSSDLLIASTTLLAYRLHPEAARSPYAVAPSLKDVTTSLVAANNPSNSAVLINNPAGALLFTHLWINGPTGHKKIIGEMSARSSFEVGLKPLAPVLDNEIQVEIRDANRKIKKEERLKLAASEPAAITNRLIFVRPTEAYGIFDERPNREDREMTQAIRVENLYENESDEGAFIIINASASAQRLRIVPTGLTRGDGTAFGGTLTFRQCVPVGSVNGEGIADALPVLGDAGLRLEPNRGAKIWLSVDAHGALSGTYTGEASVVTMEDASNKVSVPIEVQVIELTMPERFPLTLCTWDYVPNRWFSNSVIPTLDDMQKHGVNIFPRTTIPPGQVDADGKLTIEWKPLDEELSRLHRRGKILFHLNHPPLVFKLQPTERAKHQAEIDYIHEFRDYLKGHDRNYGDYAIYLLDEPGLDYGTNVNTLLDTGALFREADPKIRLYTDPVPGLSWRDFERIKPLVDIWAPNMRLVSGMLSRDPRIVEILRSKTVWSYECVAQVKSLSPLRYNRANAWRAQYFGLSGIGFWTHSTTEADMWQPGATVNDEFALVYPGEKPVPSVRWEAVRDGLEDVAAISMLEDEINRHRKDTNYAHLVGEAETELRIAKVDVMELSDQAFIESRDYLKERDRILAHTETDIKMFHRHRAEIARLTLALRNANKR